MVSIHQLAYKVGAIQTLGMVDDKAAREMMDRVALQVQPILRRHQFRVPLLREFFPKNPNLLGMNYGGGGGDCQEIMLRLRHARGGGFLDYESVLATMLHEIAHNVRGPHDAQFYKLLDELKAECEELLARGVIGTGAGFDAQPAGKVGGRLSGRELPQHERRAAAARAAELRALKAAVMAPGPRRLGGDLTLQTTCDPRRAAAIAAERRLRDNVWCPAERLGEEAGAGQGVNDALAAILGNASAADAPSGSGEPAAGLVTASDWTSKAGGGVIALEAKSRVDEPSVEPAARPLLPRAPAPGPTAAAPARAARIGGDHDEVVDLTDDPGPPAALLPKEAKRRRSAANACAVGLSPSPSWVCPACTLRNRPLALQCDACAGLRPARLAV